MTQFSKQDAAALIEHAQCAPLANLRHAEQISQLLQRFAQWHEQVTSPAAPTAAPKASADAQLPLNLVEE